MLSLPHTLGDIQLFQKLQLFAKFKRICKSKKKISVRDELDNFRQKIFFDKKISKLRWQMSFFGRFLTKVKFF